MVWTSEQTEAVAAVAHKHGVPVHLDGARVFNAAVAQNIDVRELTYPVDSVNVCLSKGLAAPVGSVLCGSLPFIERARKYRKMVGGGMRQAGIIAAAGLVAINAMVDRLAEDHANARKLAEELANIPKLKVDLSKVQTNMVVLDVSGTGMNGEAFSLAMLEQGVKVNANSEYAMRFVTNHDVSNEDINTVLAAVKRVVGA
jgi:threonine aldolase